MSNLINLPPFTEDGDVYVVVETPRGSRGEVRLRPEAQDIYAVEVVAHRSYLSE